MIEVYVKLTEIALTLTVEFAVTSVKFIETLVKSQEVSFNLIGSGNIRRKKCSCGKSTFNAYTAPGHRQLKIDNDAQTFAVSAFTASMFFGANLFVGCGLVGIGSM